MISLVAIETIKSQARTTSRTALALKEVRSPQMNQRALYYYEFGPFRINATERLLQRGSDLVPLTPKVFDTLLVLVENNGHVVEKTELMQQLWPNSFVEESSLTQNISLLRRALSELGDDS